MGHPLSFDFCVFDDEMIDCNDGFVLKYECDCRYYCDILLSMTIDTATSTYTPPIIFCSTDITSLQIKQNKHNSIGIPSPTTIAAAINKNKMKYQDNTSISQP